MTGLQGIDLDIEIQRERLRLAKPAAPAAPDIDRRTGAPATVRAAVGSAVSPQDRLATIQRYYPDARHEGDNNFVFTNPETGRPTLYNEENSKVFGVSLPTMGDVASAAPEIGEFFGGMAGGAAALAAAPATMGGTLAAVPLAVGGGALAGRETARGIAQWALGSQETRPAAEQLADQATTFGVNAVAGPIGEKIVQGAKAVVGPAARYIGGRLTDQNTLSAFERAGVHPQAGAVTGNRAIQTLEQGAFNAPGGAGVMQESFDRTLADVHQEASSIAERFATGARRNPGQAPMSAEGAGARLKEAAKGAGQRFAAERENLDNIAVTRIGADRPTALTQTQTLLTELEGELARAPNSRPELGRAITEAQRMIADATTTGGALPFDVVRKIRTRIGRELEQPDVSGYRPGEDSQMARLYGALKDDLYGAARAAGPDAERAMKVHDRYVRMFRSDAGGRVPPAETLQKVMDAKTDAQALRYAMEGAQDSTQRLMQLRRSVTPEEWDVVAASVFDSLGRAKPGAQGVSLLGETADDFSINTFLTNWSKLQSSGASSVLFRGSRYQQLQGPMNDLVKVIGSLKDSASMRNASGTARSVNVGALFSAGGAVAGGIAGGDTGSASTGAVGTLLGLTVGAYGGAKVLTSPRFVRWLAGAASNVQRNPNSLRQQLGRLAGIAEAEPYLREEIGRMIAAGNAPQPAATP